jgi:tetratricopeptide (TPR) repeat protein
MPIARNPAQHNYHWIPREAETEFQNLLKDGKAYVLPLVGVGGAGKTSLLRRFFSHCERNEIPAIYIDLPRLIVSGALDMWLRVETVHTKAFDEHRKKLNTSYETLSAMLQPYGDNASGAAELLQKGVGKDENYGLAVGAIRDAGKLVYEFWQRRENQQQQELLQKPEETLLRALAKDFQKRGVILIDTLEQAGKQNLSTRLRFRDDGELETPAAEHPRTANLIEYCAGMAHFLFDKPVIMVLAGRPPAIRELGALPLDYFAPTVDVPAFTADEIRTYLESSLPRQIAPPQDSDISKLQQLTLGNPFLLERVVRLLADWQPTWEWQVEQWQPLLNSFQQDERHGLLLYVTQRLLTHVLPDDRAFWRLALPRQYIHRDMAELLFPKDEFGEQSGLQRLKTYEEKGTIYREQDPDRYFLHDETRAAFTAWAKREKVWLDKAALEIHARLVTWFDQQSGWPAEYPDPKAKTPQNDNALLLEGAYHAFMADSSFEQREKNQDKEEFWRMLAGSPYRSNAWKRQRIDLLSTEESRETSELLEADHKRCISNFNDGTSYHLIQKATDGHLPADWQENETTLRELLKIMPDDAELWESLAWIESLSMEEREQYFEKALTLDSNNANRLNSFAVFMQVMQKNYDRTENLYQQAMTANHKSPHHINNFARFMHKIRKDYDRAEDLYQQAMNADPKSAYHISNFAHFIENIRNDYDRAEDLYQQAMNADPKSAYHISNFARFMEKIRKNFNRAETLYKQAFDAEPKNINNIRLFANFMRNVRKDYKHANKLYFQAIRDGLQDHGILCDYSRFLHNSYKKYNQAEKFYKEALRTEPECVITLTNFANFLWQIRKDFPRAEKFYEQAINIEPNNIINLRNFALFIETIRKDFDRAENLYQRAFEIDPNNTETIIKFLVFLENQGKNNIYLEKLYEKMPGIIKIPSLNENINNNLKLDLKLLTNNNGSMFKIMLKTLQSNPELEKTMKYWKK